MGSGDQGAKQVRERWCGGILLLRWEEQLLWGFCQNRALAASFPFQGALPHSKSGADSMFGDVPFKPFSFLDESK